MKFLPLEDRAFGISVNFADSSRSWRRVLKKGVGCVTGKN